MSGSGIVYKYQTALVVLPNCPPATCVPITHTAYRFVYQPDPDDQSYLPQGVKQPSRMFEGDDTVLKCSLMALSMFTTVLKARRRYKQLGKKYDVKTLLGTHLAAVPLTPAHGVVSPAASNGHMDLHEFDACDLQAIATVIEELQP